MRIMLACAAGMSTSILVRKMREAAKSENKDYEIWAVPVNDVENQMGNFDVLLLGPQVASSLNRLKALVGEKIPVGAIAYRDYGLCKAENVLKFAEDLMKEMK